MSGQIETKDLVTMILGGMFAAFGGVGMFLINGISSQIDRVWVKMDSIQTTQVQIQKDLSAQQSEIKNINSQIAEIKEDIKDI